MASAEVTKTVTGVTLSLTLEEAQRVKAVLGRQTDGRTQEAYDALERVLRGL